MTQRYHLPPGGDVPPMVAARRMGLTLEELKYFLDHAPPGGESLLKRGFPGPDPTTGNYCVEAMDAWRTRARYPQLFGEPLTLVSRARDARDVVRDRVTRMSRG